MICFFQVFLPMFCMPFSSLPYPLPQSIQVLTCGVRDMASTCSRQTSCMFPTAVSSEAGRIILILHVSRYRRGKVLLLTCMVHLVVVSTVLCVWICLCSDSIRTGYSTVTKLLSVKAEKTRSTGCSFTTISLMNRADEVSSCNLRAK